MQRGDHVLVDRAYNDRAAVGKCLLWGAVIMRYHSSPSLLESAAAR